MGFYDLAKVAWRKYVVDGVPASGLNSPDVTDQLDAWAELDGEVETIQTNHTALVARVTLTEADIAALEAVTVGISAGRIGRLTQADLFADTDYPAHTIGTVFNDPDTAKRGDYVKVGDGPGGSWSGPYAANSGAANFTTVTGTTGTITTLGATTANLTTANITTAVMADARIAGAGTVNLRMRAGGSATDTFTISQTSGDLVTMSARVGGSLTNICRIQPDGDFQVFTRILLGASQKEVATTDYVPDYARNASDWQIDATQTLARRGMLPGDNDPVILTGSDKYTIGLDNQLRSVHIKGDSTFIDASQLKVNAEFEVHVEAVVGTRKVRIWCGSDHSWQGIASPSTNKIISVTAGQNFRVKCIYENGGTGVKEFMAEPIVAAPVADASQALPVHSRSVVMLGQSILLRGTQGTMMSAFYDRLATLEVANDVFVIQASVGSTGLMKGNSAFGYWLDQDTGALGPLSTAAVAKIAAAISAGQPAPDVCFVALGQADSNYMSAAGVTTFDSYVQAWEDWALAFRTATGLPSLKFVLLPLGGEDAVVNNPATSPGTQGEARYTVTRAAIIQACLNNPTMLYQGPEYYDCVGTGASRPWNDVHLDLSGMMVLGRRLADHFANLAAGQSNDLGPRVVSVTENSATEYMIHIEGTGSIKRPDAVLLPQTLRFLPSGTPSPTQTPIDVAAISYAIPATGQLDITVTLASAASGARLAYPYGIAADTRKGLYYRDTLERPLRSCLI